MLGSPYEPTAEELAYPLDPHLRRLVDSPLGHSMIAISRPLGLSSGAIPDARITASSWWDAKIGSLTWGPAAGRLHAVTTWVPQVSDARQWFEVDLGELHVITEILLQGRFDAPYENQLISSYRVLACSDGARFAEVSAGRPGAFTGCAAPHFVSSNRFFDPFMARRVRILPVAWSNWSSMRMDIVGRQVPPVPAEIPGAVIPPC